jgi:hypothetical protein
VKLKPAPLASAVNVIPGPFSKLNTPPVDTEGAANGLTPFAVACPVFVNVSTAVTTCPTDTCPGVTDHPPDNADGV